MLLASKSARQKHL